MRPQPCPEPEPKGQELLSGHFRDWPVVPWTTDAQCAFLILSPRWLAGITRTAIRSARDGTMVVPGEYLEVVVAKR